MAKKNYQSIFDIIGPVMTGPSSSHTAGACRIGLMARKIFGETPTSVNIYLYESFAQTYQGHGTDVALVGGVLGMNPDDVNLHASLIMAKEQGITVRIIPLAEVMEHPNTAKLVMRSDDKKMSVTGISIGGGSAKVIDIDDISVDIRGDTPTILTFHQDTPGMIQCVATVLGDLGMNIASMKVDREEKGEQAHMVIELDDPLCQVSLDRIRALEPIDRVVYIEV